MRNCCIVVLNIPPGSKVLYVESISEHPHEKEVLIDRHGRFAVTLVTTRVDVNKIFVSYIPKAAPIIPPSEFEPAIESAVDQQRTIQRVLEIFPADEYDLFRDDEEALIETIKDIYKQLVKFKPNASTIKSIQARLKILYDK